MKENLLNNVRKRVMVWVALASMATLLPAQTYRLSGCVQDENRQQGYRMYGDIPADKLLC